MIDKGRARIWFVTEGEASLHACLLSGLASEVLVPTQSFFGRKWLFGIGDLQNFAEIHVQR